MAEYYAVLRKAVGGLGPNAGVAEARRSVYDKARNALIGQLKAVDPPLTTAEISRQRLELEEAIRKVERETSGAAQPPPPPRPALTRREPPPEPEPEPEPANGGPSPQDVFRRAIQDAESRGNAAGAYERAVVPARPQARETRAYSPERDYRDRPPPDRGPPRDEPPPRRGEPDYDRGDRRGPEPRRGQEPPRLAPEYEQEWEEPQPPPPSGRAQHYERPERELPPPPPPRSGRRRPPEEEPEGGYDRETPRRRSGLGRLVFFILILAVLGGGAFFVWSQWPKVSALISMFDSGPSAKKPAKTTAAAPAPAPAAEPSTKDSDRLLPGEPPKTVRTVDSTPAPAADGSDAESLPGAPDATAPDAAGGSDDAAADAGADAAPDATAPAPTTETASTDDGGAADTTAPQKAILYEEPLNAAGAATGVTAINANVAWKFVPNGPNGPEIEADLQVPERAMKVKFSLRKNADASLPASHLVEVVIDIPGDFPGKGIRSVPRIVMKPTEEARGQPLIGAAAKVADGFFWIALSAAAADVTTNLDLLKSQDWIDLPFVYETGQRAILTFEKGGSGDQVFQKAVAAWTPG